MKALIFILFILCGAVCFGQTVSDLRPTVTMKEYVDMKIEMLEKINEVRDENIRDNVNKTNASIDKKFESVNEFRSQLKDQAGTFITRGELWGYVLAICGLLFGFMNMQRKKNVRDKGNDDN